MPEVPVLAPELVRQAVSLSRALSAAVRNWALYPPEHPAVDSSMGRLAHILTECVNGEAFTIGVTPSTLIVTGLPLPDDQPVTEAARILHDRDILQITFTGAVPSATLQALVRLLSTPADDLRASGGPARAWEAAGDASVAIVQIDYERILEDHEGGSAPATHDDVWRSLVGAIVEGKHVLDERQQQRLLEIAGDVGQLQELADAVIAPKATAADGSPLVTTQGATVLAVYRHITGIVQVKEPDKLNDAIRNIAEATAKLDPNVVTEMLQSQDEEGARVARRIASAFTDEEVAKIVGSSLARDGKASARLAEIFDTIAPDVERKRRVLTMARSQLSTEDFGADERFDAVWRLMEAQLLNYDERAFVSENYQLQLANIGTQGKVLATHDLPVEMPEWMETLDQDNVRTLSVLLIVDLLRIETKPDRAAEIASDLAALGEDLFMAGAFDDAHLVVKTLRESSEAPEAVAPAACRAAGVSLGQSAALREAAGLLGDFDDPTLAVFAECCTFIGPSAIDALQVALESEHETRAHKRARDIAAGYGASGIPHFAKMTDDPRWYVQHTAAELLGATRAVEAVASLQALLHRSDDRVLRAAVLALAGISDPSAARAIQVVLRSVTGSSRRAVLGALVAARDVRVVPMLARMLAEADPFGDEHEAVLDTLDTVRQLADERAVPAVATVMNKKRFFRRKKARAFKEASVAVLRAIGSASAQKALDTASHTGDRLLRRIIAQS